MPLEFDLPIPTVTLTTYDQLSYGWQMGQTAPTSTVPTANRALYLPFFLWKPATAYKMFVVNGATVSGNLDMGIYDHTGLRIASIGSTAQAGVNSMQEVAFASPVKLGAGFFFMALALNNAVGAFFRRSLSGDEQAAAGGYQEGSAFPLPAQATFNSLSSSYIPLMGVRFYNA